MWRLLQIYKRNQGRTDKSLLKISELLSKIKLHHMSNTWAFTRTGNMLYMLFETNIFIVVSNLKNITYFCMILVMIADAGLIGLVYPVAVLGYAMLEETRPRKEFWNFFLYYTMATLFIKFIYNLSILSSFKRSEAFLSVDGWARFGVYDYSNLLQLTLYMLPELLVVTCIMTNEIFLRLTGLHYQIEEDLENLEESIQRTVSRDKESIAMEKKIRANMVL